MVISIALFGLAVLVQLGGQSVNIPIQNPSFEQYGATTRGPCGDQAATTPGWNTSLGTGIFIPDLTIPGCDNAAPPDGKAVLLIGPGYSISQDLGTPATQPRGTYTLLAYVGNYNFQYQGEYTISLTVGDTVWCSVSGFAIGQFVQIPLLCSMRDRPPANLRITFSAEYEPLMFDKVSLTFAQVQ